MDLLGSIIGSMDKPPARDKKEKDMYEKRKKEYEKLKNREREELNRFRSYVEERLGRLMKDDNRHYMEFQPLDQLHRSVVHDIAETAGLVGISFGVEEEGRYIVVYKKEHQPSKDELDARRNGDPWNKETAKQYGERRRAQELEEKQRKARNRGVKGDGEAEQSLPHTDYKDKYAHLIGQDAAIDAAKRTVTNRTYGYVPSENKRDLRSIEQTMADIQAKKKRKIEQTEVPPE